MKTEEMMVTVDGIITFTGTYEECKDYIVNNFTFEEFNVDYIDIIQESGRCASFVLEWK